VEEVMVTQAEEKAFEFTAGIYGFPALKRFLVAEIPGGGDVFKQMVSLERPEVGFTLVFPFAFFPGYDPDIPDEEMEEIGAASPDQVILMVIANIPIEFKDATANLRAPIVFNPHTKQARQVILSDERHSVSQRLFKLQT
jgi:flagellar assembly factor FliW